MTYQIIDVRQSSKWANFLSKLGWQNVRTSNGVVINIIKSPIGVMAKIQKPVPLQQHDLNEIADLCKENKVLFVKIEPYVGQDVDLLKNNGYKASMFPLTPTATYLIHLDNTEEQLWNNISHSGKYSINRAKREGAHTKVFVNPDEKTVTAFYEILKQTGQLKKFYVPPMSQIMSQVEAFGNDGHLIMVYDKNDNLCAAKWYVVEGDRVLYVSGGTSAIGRKDKSGYELLWQSILYFKKLGCTLLDLEGKDDPRFPSTTATWGGFSHFKSKFGGEEIYFPYPYVKFFNPILKKINDWTGINF